MRRDIHNFPELVDAVNEMQRNQLLSEPRVLVFHDPGGITFGFVLGDHGLSKFDTDKRGNEIRQEPYPERSKRPFLSEGGEK